MFPGKVENCMVERLSYMFSPQGFLSTEIIDVQSLDIGQNVAVCVLLEYAEGVSLQAVIVVYSGQDRALFISQDLFQLFVRVLAFSIFKQVRPSLVVDQGYLCQQAVDPLYVFFFSLSLFVLWISPW